MSQGIKDGKDDSHDNPDKNRRFCHVLSVALSDIIRHSANVDFRDRCFELSRSGSSSGVQAALAADLLSIVSRDDHPAQKRQAQTTEDDTVRDTRDEDPG